MKNTAYKTLILTLLFVLFASSAEAYQEPWKHRLPIDEMTGRKRYTAEKVKTSVDIEAMPWGALLSLYCGSGNLSFSLWQYGSSDYFKSVKLDTEEDIALLRVKFDNKEPFVAPWRISEKNSDRVSIYDNLIPDPPEGSPEIDKFKDEIIKLENEIIKIRKRIIKGMIKHRRLWIGFKVKGSPFIAKFDLTGFSRELAKCSKIPDTN